MGKGLDFSHSGTHIVFAAGTGILAFADWIAYLLLSLVKPGLLNSSKQISDDFECILHYSYASEKEAVCLDLIQSLLRVC